MLGEVVVVSVDDLGIEVDGDDAGGDDVVGGDADGVRSPGRSLVRGVPESVQAVASVATSARAETLNSALFMNAPPEWCSHPVPRVARPVPRSASSHCFS